MRFLNSALLTLSLFATACGSSSKSKDETPTGTSSVSFAAMNTALSNSCAGSSCHSSGSPYGAYVNNQGAVDADLDDIYEEVSSGRMPLSGTLSAEDKATILAYTRR